MSKPTHPHNYSGWLDPDAHCVVSDASVFPNSGISGFAWAIYEKGKLTRKGEASHDSPKSVQVEIAGYLAVIRKVPRDGKPVHLLHDIDCLDMMVNRRVSYQQKLEPEISQLQKELSSREYRLFREKGEPAHRDCHNRARSFLRRQVHRTTGLQDGSVYWVLRGDRHLNEGVPGSLRWLKTLCYHGPGNIRLPRSKGRQQVFRLKLLQDDPCPGFNDQGTKTGELTSWKFQTPAGGSQKPEKPEYHHILQDHNSFPFPVIPGKRCQNNPPGEAKAYLNAHFACQRAWRMVRTSEEMLILQEKSLKNHTINHTTTKNK